MTETAQQSEDHLPLHRIQDGLTGVDCTCGWLSFDYRLPDEAWTWFGKHRVSLGLEAHVSAEQRAGDAQQ